MNEPWCYSWDELKDIPLNALALIWSKPRETQQFTNADAMEVVRRAQQRKRRECEGIWYRGD